MKTSNSRENRINTNFKIEIEIDFKIDDHLDLKALKCTSQSQQSFYFT